jgi:hypothetical protein
MSKTEHIQKPDPPATAAAELLQLGTDRFRTVLADPPWRFQNRTGKMAPEHRRLSRYGTMPLDEIMELPVAQVVQDRAHLYLWVPNALILEGLDVMRRRRRTTTDHQLCSGPGKLCQALGITRALDGAMMKASPVTVRRGRIARADVVAATPRIGISKAADWPLRFVIHGSHWASRRSA